MVDYAGQCVGSEERIEDGSPTGEPEFKWRFRKWKPRIRPIPPGKRVQRKKPARGRAKTPGNRKTIIRPRRPKQPSGVPEKKKFGARLRGLTLGGAQSHRKSDKVRWR